MEVRMFIQFQHMDPQCQQLLSNFLSTAVKTYQEFRSQGTKGNNPLSSHTFFLIWWQHSLDQLHVGLLALHVLPLRSCRGGGAPRLRQLPAILREPPSETYTRHQCCGFGHFSTDQDSALSKDMNPDLTVQRSNLSYGISCCYATRVSAGVVFSFCLKSYLSGIPRSWSRK